MGPPETPNDRWQAIIGSGGMTATSSVAERLFFEEPGRKQMDRLRPLMSVARQKGH
jgi:hypothetical protein